MQKKPTRNKKKNTKELIEENPPMLMENLLLEITTS